MGRPSRAEPPGRRSARPAQGRSVRRPLDLVSPPAHRQAQPEALRWRAAARLGVRSARASTPVTSAACRHRRRKSDRAVGSRSRRSGTRCHLRRAWWSKPLGVRPADSAPVVAGPAQVRPSAATQVRMPAQPRARTRTLAPRDATGGASRPTAESSRMSPMPRAAAERAAPTAPAPASPECQPAASHPSERGPSDACRSPGSKAAGLGCRAHTRRRAPRDATLSANVRQALVGGRLGYSRPSSVRSSITSSMCRKWATPVLRSCPAVSVKAASSRGS